MPTAERFDPPADQRDFPDDPEAQARLAALWNTRVDGFTQQSILGNPWSATNAAYHDDYYNPLDTAVPPTASAVPVQWVAMPHRLDVYLGPGSPYGYTREQLWELADTGYVTGSGGTRRPLGDIPVQVCPSPDWDGPLQPYGPYGPRGWQDEYCEWSVTRDAAGKITRVDFTCENPEYWYSLWQISPERVAELYQQTLNAGVAAACPHIKVTVDDLVLRDPSSGAPVLDPATGRPAYDPLNKWNDGPESVRTGDASSRGGAMHLTSTPNTLQTEIGLGGAATTQRSIDGQNPAYDPQKLICCAQYGQSFRHSDPNIGQSVNLLVGRQTRVSLANPVGLYIQTPNFSSYRLPDDPKLPAGAQPSDCWQVVRGTQRLLDPVTGTYFDAEFILHATFQLPAAWVEAGVGFTVGDITIGGRPIRWAAQITETFHIGLNARPIPAEVASPAQPCVGVPEEILPQPLQLLPESLWDAYSGTPTSNPVGVPTTLANNTIIVPPIVQPGAQGLRMALTCSGAQQGPGGELPRVAITGGDVTVHVRGLVPDVTYTVPGDSYPSDNQLLLLTVDVAPGAAPGTRGLAITNPGQQAPPIAAPAYLQVAGPSEAGS